MKSIIATLIIGLIIESILVITYIHISGYELWQHYKIVPAVGFVIISAAITYHSAVHYKYMANIQLYGILSLLLTTYINTIGYLCKSGLVKDIDLLSLDHIKIFVGLYFVIFIYHFAILNIFILFRRIAY